MIVGPCSIHSLSECLEFAKQLKGLQKAFGEKIFFIQRAYFEKPRTILGWKGYLNDPYLDQSYKMEEALEKVRELGLRLCDLEVPIATEILSPCTYQYYLDFVTWGAIGARTTESQIHREIASSLPFPVGFKNTTAGRVIPAINAIKFSREPHYFLGLDETNSLVQHQSQGNKDTHLVLRGGDQGSNYYKEDIILTCNRLEKENLPLNILVDCSHGNSKILTISQNLVIEDLLGLIRESSSHLMGIMLEVNLQSGSQPLNNPADLKPGISITDPCLSFKNLAVIAEKVYNACQLSTQVKQ